MTKLSISTITIAHDYRKRGAFFLDTPTYETMHVFEHYDLDSRNLYRCFRAFQYPINGTTFVNLIKGQHKIHQ